MRLTCILAPLAAIGLVACERDPAPAPSPSAIRVEAADPEMLLEGPTVVMGLRLPAGSTVMGKKVTSASVSIPHPMEKVSNYLRAHLETTSVETGPQKTVFLGAKPKTAAATDQPLKVVVIRKMFGAELLIYQDEKPNQTYLPRPPSSADAIGRGEGRELPAPSSSVKLPAPLLDPNPPEDD